MEFVNKIPNWLRWILILPSAVLAFLIATFITKIGIGIFWAAGSFIEYGKFTLDNFEFFILEAVVSGLSAYAFVWAGVKVAPRHNFSVAALLIVLLIFMLGVAFYSKIAGHADSSWLTLIVSAVVSITAGIYAAKGISVV